MCRASKEIRFYKTQALFTYSVSETKSICKTQYLTVQKTKKIQATYDVIACFTMCFRVVVQNAGTKHVQRSKNKVNLQNVIFYSIKCKVNAGDG